MKTMHLALAFAATLAGVWPVTWSPRPYVVAREMLSVRKHGYRKAKLLAIRARHAGLRNME
jgi:hypothetical protein